jgi:hypothetical protein
MWIYGLILLGLIPIATLAGGVQELPPLLNEEILGLAKIGLAKSIKIVGEVEFPKGTKITPTAPSHLTLYEKMESHWNKVGEQSLAAISPPQKIKFEQKFLLRSATSELTYDVVVYYCSEKIGTCSLHSYRGELVRSPSAHDHIDFKVKLPPLGGIGKK